MKYRKLPVEIEAIQLLANQTSIHEVNVFINNGKPLDTSGFVASERWEQYVDITLKNGGILIKTLESKGDGHFASFGDYVIKGVKGEFYACKPEIFELTYEKIANLD